MRFYREKSWLLGLLALIAPLPLPFNGVVGWPAVIAFCGAAALFMVRTDRGEDWVLPYWVMNLLGLLYIPILIGDLSILRAGRVLPPLVNLALYVHDIVISESIQPGVIDQCDVTAEFVVRIGVQRID